MNLVGKLSALARRCMRIVPAACVGMSAFAASAVTIDLATQSPPSPLVLTSNYEYTNSGATTKDLTIDVAAGATSTCAAKITGNVRLVKTGAGTLVVTAANTYTGGTLHSGGKLEAGNTSAFGAAKSTITLNVVYEVAKLGFYGIVLPDGTYDYHIDRTSSQLFILWLGGSVLFKGNIGDSTGKATGSFLVTQIANVNPSNFNSFNGTITLPSANLVNCCYHDNAFNGKVTVNQIQTKTGESSSYGTFYPVAYACGGTFYLNAANDIKALWIRASGLRANAAGAFGDGSAYLELSGQVYGSGKMTLAADQTLAYLKGKPNNIGATSDDAQFTSTAPQALTVAGAGTNEVWMALNGQVSVVYAPTGDGMQTFAGPRVSKTTGSLTALTRGTLELGGTTTWKNVPTLTAGAGARILVSTTEAKPLAGVKTLNVAGTFEIAAGLGNPFADEVSGYPNLNVTTGGKLKVPAGTALNVVRLTVDGVRQPAGTYRAGDVDWLEGEGATVSNYNYVRMTKADIDAYKAETLDVSGGCVEFVLAAGETATFGAKIVGNGYVVVSGAGTLGLSGDNAYTGGTYLTGEAGILRAQSAAAFGTGAVHLEGYKSWLALNTATATFANDFVVAANAVLAFAPTAASAQITVAGSVTATADFYISISAKGETSAMAAGAAFTFAGPVDAAGKAITFVGTATGSPNVNFEGSVTAARVRNPNLMGKGPYDRLCYNNDWGYGRSAKFNFCAANAVDLFVPYWATYYPKHPQAFTDITTLSAADYRQDGYHHTGVFDFGGLSMTVGSIELVDREGFAFGSGTSVLKSSQPATLTVVGGGSYPTDACFQGALSLDWSPQDASSTLMLSNQAHTTSGKITVSKGTVWAAGNGVSFKNLTALEVKAGATFRLDTGVAGALAALTTLVVEPGGVFEIARGEAPFGNAKAAVEITTSASVCGEIRLADGVEAKLAVVRVDGEAVPNGTYRSGDVGWLKGGGTVVVDSVGAVANIWLSAKSGAWEGVANWSKKALPRTSWATVVNARGPSYAISLTENAGTIGQFSIVNEAPGQTAALNMSAPLAVDFGESAVDIGKGALVSVAAGGAFGISCASLTSDKVRVNVHDGGEFWICGGDANLTNYTGQINAASGGRITVSSGVLRTKAANYRGRALTADNGGVIEVTGGQLLFNSWGWGQDALVAKKGGRIDVSGNAVVAPLDGISDSCVFGDGEVTFRGHSTFGRSGIKNGVGGWGYGFAAGSEEPTGTVTFVDHARFYDTSSSIKVDRGEGTVARIVFDSATNHVFNWKTYLGSGKGGRGEVVVHRGTLRQNGQGLRLAGAYEKQGATAALTAEGYVRVDGEAALEVFCGNAPTEYDINGLVVGDGIIATTNKTTGLAYGDNMRGYVEIADDASITLGSSAAFIVGVGSTNAFGRVSQTGGTFVDTSTSQFGRAVVGMGGGTGEWILSGGEVRLSDGLFVGGALLADFSRTLPPRNGGRLYVGERDYPGMARGLLKLTGGKMTIARDLVFSKDGEGTLELGPGANLVVNGALDARDGSKLVIDARGFGGKRAQLATFGSTTRAFADENTTFLKDEGSFLICRIQDDGIRILQPVGWMVIVY